MARTILVADPDVTTLELATAALTRAGFRVESTNDGGDALARFLESAPCVVICDTALPVLSGPKLCREIRDLSHDTRLVLMRGFEDAEIDETGVDAVLDRPFRLGPLKVLLGKWGLLEEEEVAAESLAFGIPPAPALSAEERTLPEIEAEPLDDDDEQGLPEIEAEPLEDDEQEIAAEPPEDDEQDLPEIAVEPLDPALAHVLDAVQRPVEPPTPPDLVPTPPAPDLAPAPQLPAAGPAPTSPGAPLPIPVPVPTADDEGIAIDRERISTTAGVPAERGLPPSVPRVGTLAEVSLPRLLFELYTGTYSGKLNLEREGNQRTIHFWAGLPINVGSTQLNERLGALLRDEGRITEEQYHRGTEVALERGVRIGEALISLGFLSESDLLHALATQTENKLVNTLAWRTGNYELIDDASFIEGEVPTDVQPLKVIWRGVHEHYDLSAMMSFFSKLRDRYVVATELFPAQFEVLGPHLRNLSVTTWLDGKTTFEAALRSDDTRALQIAQALYVLLVTDMVRASAEPGEPAPVVERKKTASSAPVDYRFLMELSERIAREYLRVKGKDHYTVLDVPRDASTAAIEEAYREAVVAARRDLERSGLPHDSVKRLREIIDILGQARTTLTTDRQTYDASLGPTEVAAAPGAPDTSQRKALFDAEHAYREGVRLLEMLDGRGARKQFEQALLGNPAEPTYRVAIAQALLLEHRDDLKRAMAEAFIYLEDALRIDPGNLPANLEAARLFVKQGEPDKARTHLERVLQRAPHHQKARLLLDSL